MLNTFEPSKLVTKYKMCHHKTAYKANGVNLHITLIMYIIQFLQVYLYNIQKVVDPYLHKFILLQNSEHRYIKHIC